jgi:hypothetical protein
VQSGSNCLRIDTVAGYCERDIKPFSCIKAGGFWPPQKLSALAGSYNIANVTRHSCLQYTFPRVRKVLRDAIFHIIRGSASLEPFRRQAKPAGCLQAYYASCPSSVFMATPGFVLMLLMTYIDLQRTPDCRNVGLAALTGMFCFFLRYCWQFVACSALTFPFHLKLNPVFWPASQTVKGYFFFRYGELCSSSLFRFRINSDSLNGWAVHLRADS